MELVFACSDLLHIQWLESIPRIRGGTENVFSDIRVLSIEIYVLSLVFIVMGINLVQDKGPRD